MTKRLKTIRISLVLLAATVLLAGCIFSEADSATHNTVAVQETSITASAYESAEEKEEAPMPYAAAPIIYELDGIVMSAYIPDISDGRFHNEILNGLNYQAETNISLAIVENDRIYISGDINGMPFQVEGYFSSISQNGNILVFNAEDKLGNFRVIHCSVAGNITQSIHYFQVFSNDNTQYNVAILLYLTTHHIRDFAAIKANSGFYLVPHGERDLAVIEIFGKTFPTISAEAIDALPEFHYRNLWWSVNMPMRVWPSPVTFEIGRVTINSDGRSQLPPARYFLLGAYYFDNDMFRSVSQRISFERWLENRFGVTSVIHYSSNLQVSLEGAFGEILTGTHPHTVYHNDSTLTAIGIPAEDFIDGTAHVSIPDEAGTYLIYVDVKWSGGGNDFALHRYLFKVLR